VSNEIQRQKGKPNDTSRSREDRRAPTYMVASQHGEGTTDAPLAEHRGGGGTSVCRSLGATKQAEGIETMDIIDVISWVICIAFFIGAIALAAAWTHVLIQLPTWYEETLRKEKENEKRASNEIQRQEGVVDNERK
jgi:preprotein translocase subunit SecG